MVQETATVPAGGQLLKILMVAPTSFFNDYGGHIRILEETLALQALGHRVTIVTYYKGNDFPGLNIRRTWALPYRAEYEVGSSRHKLAFDLFLMAKTIQVGRQERPDIIHGHMHEGALIGGALARLFRRPLVFDFQGSLSGEMVDHNFLNIKGPIYPWVRAIEKQIDHFADAILTSSHRAQMLLEEQFSVPAGRIYPLPDCVDTDRFDPDRFNPGIKINLRSELGIPADRPVVVYLGLLANYQGTSDLLAAAKSLKRAGKDVHFLVMGYPKVDRYKYLAQEMDIDDIVTFTGRIKYEDAPLYLSLGDIAVSPKKSTTEGSGKVLNYMAMRLPIIASDSPVHREYLADLGIYVPMGDFESLARAIVDNLSSEGSGNRLGQKLRQRAIEDYSWQLAGRRIVKLYERLLGNR